MLIKIDKDCNICFTTHKLEEGLNFFGIVKGQINPYTFELRKILTDDNQTFCEKVCLENIDGEYICVNVKNNKFYSISSGLSLNTDIFYTVNKDYIIFSDNFWEMINEFLSLELDYDAVKYFIKHGYFKPGETFFKEIRRVKPLSEARFINSKIIELSIFNFSDDNLRNYETFKKAFNSSIDTFGYSNSDTILLSGGIDSGLISALLVKEKGVKPNFLAMEYKQPLNINKLDIKRAEKIVEFYNSNLNIVDVDFNEYSCLDLNKTIQKMPLAAHLSLGFLEMFKNIKKDTTRVWCGQNADSLYNLGPTSKFSARNPKSIGQLMKRFLISEPFISTLNNVNSPSKTKLLNRLFGYVVKKAFETELREKFYLPNNSEELENAFLDSNNYLALSSKPFKNMEIQKGITTLSVKINIFDQKYQSFIIGRDSRVVFATSQVENNFNVILPYSTGNMVKYFRSLELTWKDILHPKLYIDLYLKELIGKNEYNRLYNKGYLLNENSLDFNNWEHLLLQETNFGNSLKEANTRKIFELKSIQDHISNYWMETVIEKVISKNILVKI